METPTKEQRDELRRKWIAALRGGEYQQCRNVLHRESDDYGDSHCCLGVAEIIAGGINSLSYEGIIDVFGLKTAPDKDIASGPLVRMNDKEAKSFSEIADFIEQHPEQVFVDAPAPVAALEGEWQ